jgi:hypothetical protein
MDKDEARRESNRRVHLANAELELRNAAQQFERATAGDSPRALLLARKRLDAARKLLKKLNR